MATGDTSSPVRFGKGASSPVDNRELFLSIFGGEILTAFDSATVTLDKHFVKQFQVELSLIGSRKLLRPRQNITPLESNC